MHEALLHGPSTGSPDLDRALGGLYWGDNVVWEHDAADPATPFYAAVEAAAAAFDDAFWVTVDRPPATALDVIDARPGTPLAQPGALLAAIARRGGRRGRSLVLFESMDAMSERWGIDTARRFFVRCCPMLLEVGAIAYWSLSLRGPAAGVRRAIADVTQCVLVLRDGRLRVAKAEGRPPGVQGSVYRYTLEDGLPHLEAATTSARLGAALRALRAQRGLSQRDLAAMAGVSPSAISQAERGIRGLSLDTLLDMTAELDITVDELLRGQSAPGYRLGRRDDPAAEPTGRPTPLLDDPGAGLRAYLVRLPPGGAGKPHMPHQGLELIAGVGGLVQIVLSSGRPVLRPGDALMADRETVVGWRNIGHRPASLLWILRDG